MRTNLILFGLVALTVSPAACKRNGDSSDAPECSGRCGKGTRCDGKVCVVDYSQDVCVTQDVVPVEEVPIRPPITSWGECTLNRNQLPKKFVPVDDSAILEHDVNRPRAVDWADGDEQLNEPVLNANMREIEYAINECLAIAACYNKGSIKGGSLNLVVSLIGKTGKADAVSVTAPPDLQIFGIVPCIRTAVAAHQFPRFNGPSMTVKYSIEIGGTE